MLKKANLNNNEFTPLSAEVQAAMKNAIETYANTLIEGYGNDYKQFSEIEETKEVIAQSINVNSNEIYFTHGNKETAISLIDKAVFLLGVKLVVTSDFESKEKLDYLKQIEQNGFIEIYYIPCSKYGELELNWLKDFLEKNTKKALISLSHANIYTGVLLPVKELSRLSKKYNVLFHLNAQLTFGRFQLNFSDAKPDFVSFDTILLNGPTGISCLIISEELKTSDEQYNLLINHIKVIYSPSIALVAGFKTAVDIAMGNIAEKQQVVSKLKTYFSEQLKEKLDIKSVDLYLKKKSLFNQLAFFLPKENFGDFLFEKLDLNSFILPHFEYPIKLEGDHYFISVALNEKNDKSAIDGFISILHNFRNDVDKI